MEFAGAVLAALRGKRSTASNQAEGTHTMTTQTTQGNPVAGTIHWLNNCISRSQSEVFSEIVSVSPGLAAELMRRNEHNRSVRITKSTQYAADMRAKRWTFNGEPILISNTGELNDGQHRMQAIIDANLVLPFLFVFGVSRESRTTVDQGASRGAQDYLNMEGVPYASIQSSVARCVIGYERGDTTRLKNLQYVTNSDIMARVYSDKDIGRSSHFAQLNRKAAMAYATPAVIGFCHYVLSKIDEAQADEYMGQVCRGEALLAKDPAYTVRDRLVTMETKSRERLAHVIFRGWNAYRQGRKLSIVKVMGDDNLPAVI